MNWQAYNPFRKVTPDEMTVIELEDARRQLLESQSLKEYYTAIEKYNLARIDRLTKLLRDVA